MTIFAVPAQRTWSDIQTIEAFLVVCWPTTVIELGTGTGAFSAFLAGYTSVHGFDFYTFDTGQADHEHQRPHPGAIAAIRALGGYVHTADVFAPVTVMGISALISNSAGPVFLYCDNGDKPREIETYGPLLRTGDYLGVHDYGTEITELPGDGYSLWNPKLFEENDSSNRILERVS